MVRKFVYTLSSRRSMVQDAIRSIRTLDRFTEPENIVVFYTPPRDESHRSILEDLGVDLRLESHKATEFRAVRHEQPRHYGDKLHLCDVEADELAFLDCDTIVAGDVTQLFDGDFEFAARPDNAHFSEEWEELSERASEDPLSWMPNAGLLLFKDAAHQRIQDTWRRYMTHDFDLEVGVKDYRDQYSLAVAAGELRSKKLDPQDHVYEWHDPPTADGTVYHMVRTDSDLPSEVHYPLSKLYGWYQEVAPWQQ